MAADTQAPAPSAPGPKRKGGEKTNLGRGLSALLGAAPVAAATTSGTGSGPASAVGGVHSLPVEFLQPGKYQPRHTMDDAAIDDLAASVREKGILQPILVRPLADSPDGADRYEIIAGERRWRAAQLAQLHDVPVLIRDLDDQETLEIGLIENLQREDLSALEEAEAYRRLMDEFEHTQEVLSKHVGKSRSHVANMMRLLGLPDQVKVMIDAGALSAGHARALLAAEDPVSTARMVAKKGLNVRQTEKLVKKGLATASGDGPTGKRPGRAGAEKDADTRALEGDLTRLLGLNVEITFQGQGGVLALHYGTLEQLDDLLHRLTLGGLGSEPETTADPIDDLMTDDLVADDLAMAADSGADGAGDGSGEEPEANLVDAANLTFSESEIEAITADIAEEESLMDRTPDADPPSTDDAGDEPKPE